MPRLSYPWTRAVLALVTVSFLASCQRPFVAVSTPVIEILEPDPSTVFTLPEIFVRVRTTSFRAVSRVFLGDREMAPSIDDEIWEASVSLSAGLNRLIITAFDEEDLPATDTLLVFHMTSQVDRSQFRMNTPVGGQSITRLGDGSYLIAGGAGTVSGPAVRTVQRIATQGTSVESTETHLVIARAGHTATLLPDGRVLFLGGGTTTSPTSIADLVETPELYRPTTESFDRVSVVGPPIRRIFHTANVFSTPDGPVIDLLGGEGDTEYVPDPLFGIRRDIRSFLLQRDTLFALSPAIGPFVVRSFGHSQTSLSSLGTGERGKFLVSGIRFNTPEEPTGLFMDYRTNLGILIDPGPIPQFPRYFHAATLLRNGLIVIAGGLSLEDASPVSGAELYVDQMSRFLSVPQTTEKRLSARYLHNMVLIAPDKILFLGGFSENGTAISESDVFEFSL